MNEQEDWKERPYLKGSSQGTSFFVRARQETGPYRRVLLVFTEVLDSHLSSQDNMGVVVAECAFSTPDSS